MRKQFFLKIMIFLIAITLTGCTSTGRTRTEDSSTNAALQSKDIHQGTTDKVDTNTVDNVTNKDYQHNASYVIDSKVYIVGDNEDNWQNVNVAPSDGKEVSNAFFIDKNNGLVVGSDDKHERTFIYRTKDRGKSWDTTTIDVPGYLSYISFSDKNHGWILLKSEGAMMHEEAYVIQTKDGGVTWNVVSKTSKEGQVKGSIPAVGKKTGISFCNDQKGWITLDQPVNGQAYLIFTKDGGSTWEERSLKIPEKYKDYAKSAQAPLFYSDKNGILEVELYDPGSDAKTFIFYTTQDGGENWTAGSELIPTPGKGFYWYGFYSTDHGYVTDGNVLYYTQDGGKVWKVINKDISIPDIQDMVFLNDKSGWIITQQGNFKTTDGGIMWGKSLH